MNNLNIRISKVTIENLLDLGIFCIKDRKSIGFQKKVEWYKKNIENGLIIKIAFDNTDKQLGFIEYIPSEFAWRPIQAKSYYFIQCIATFRKEERNKGIANTLISECESDAKVNDKSGICTICSDGPWIANKNIFTKNNFIEVEKNGRFELMHKAFNDKFEKPRFIDWTKELKNYNGWHLIYSDQCPWHEKSVIDLTQTALRKNINLSVVKISTPKEAQYSPTGFGTFGLIKDGVILADHYISKTRFENILKELKIK